MAADQAALVLALPTDTVDTVLKKVREAGSSSVQVLVADGITTFQSLKELERLKRGTASRGITLVLISSDEQTLKAAKQAQIDAMEVRNTHVTLPSSGTTIAAATRPIASPFVTQRLPNEPTTPPVVAPRVTSSPPPVQRPPSEPVPESDEEFLRALDQRAAPSPPNRQKATPPSPQRSTPSDDDVFAELDSLSAAIHRAPAHSAPPIDDFAAELDAFSAAATATPPRASAPPPPARPRIRPEDIELTAAERQRAAAPPASRSRPNQPLPPPPPRSHGAAEAERERAAPPPRGTSWREMLAPPKPPTRQRRVPQPPRAMLIVVLLATILLIVLLVVGGWFVINDQASVTLYLPPVAMTQESFTQLGIPLNDQGTASNTAVQGQSLAADVTFHAQGRVADEVLAPAASASGIIAFTNIDPTIAFQLPVGTEFIAYNAQGQEVRFVSKAAVTVPPASTTRQGAQIITSLGTAEVEVVARAPGSASNVEANTIQLVAIPGLNPFGVQAGSTLEVSHDPLTGGAEATVRIVKDSDVAQVLSAALTGLENQARQMLEQRASQANLKLEATTISPNISDFEQLTGYELSVEPPVGQMVNNANPVFTITVQGHFNAFAAPASDPLPNQLQRVVSAVLLSEGKLTLDGKRIPAITNWHWDGTRLTVDGTISPNPNYTGQKLSQPTQATIRQQILGKTRAEAQAALDNLVQQGIISGYNLPDRDRLPSWDMQLDLMVEPAPTP